MIHRDHSNIIVDQTGDGGDSANRSGLAALCGSIEPLNRFEVAPGVLVRHPDQAPWNFPGNFSRDQLIPFVAGCWRQKEYHLVHRVFWKHAGRLFFCQNFYRDEPGTRKYPWPHFYISDHGRREFKWFDFADPLLPNDIWHLILCGRIWYLYWFAPIGYFFLTLAIIAHGLLNRSNDEGQIISEVVVAGPVFVHLYKGLKPRWAHSLKSYWEERRNMGSMSQLIARQLSE